MKQHKIRRFLASAGVLLLSGLAGCGCMAGQAGVKGSAGKTPASPMAGGNAAFSSAREPAAPDITFGSERVRGFRFDNVLHDPEEGDIHFGMFVPEGYDGSEPYALFITLPGYGGLRFQGTGVNIRTEDFGVEARKYNEKMIIIAPQLDD